MRLQFHSAIPLATFAAAILATALAGAASARTAPDPLEDLLNCRQLTDSAARLACFDAAAAAVSQARASGDLVTVQQSDLEAVERESFGLNLEGLTRLGGSLFRGRGEASPGGPQEAAADGVRVIERASDGAIARAAYMVDRVSTLGHGRLRFHMQNGQIWDQTDSRPIRPPRGGEPFEVEIRAGALSNFLLSVPGSPRSTGVRRAR